MRLTVRHRSPDHTEQAMVGGVNLSPCMHSTALPPPHPQVSPPRGLSSASQGRAGQPERLVLVDLWGQSLSSLGKAQVQAVWTADMWSPEPLRSGLKGAGSRREQGIQS